MCVLVSSAEVYQACRKLGIHSTVIEMEEETTDTNSQALTHLNDCSGQLCI